MSIISIVHSQGGGSTEIVESGKHLALQPGDKVVIDAEANAMTSALKAESSLIFTVHTNLNYTIDNFFSDNNNRIEFKDVTYSPNEFAKKLIVSLTVTHHDGVVRELSAAPFSIIPTHAGDKYEFLNSEVSYNDVHRKGNDLLVYFEPQSAAAGKYITLSKFFGHTHSGLSDPLLLLTDKEHNATDIIVHSEHNEQLQWHGVPITSATPGVPYGYYFYLTGDNLKSVEVDLESLEGALPAWLTLVPLALGEFILSGTPPRDFSGQLKLEIRAHETRDGVRLHTQQSFELTAIGAARRSAERALATSVIAAELRGASSSTTAAQSILTGSDSLAGMMSSTAMVIASASSTSALNVLEARPVLVSTFENLSVRALGISQLDVVRTPVQIPVTITTSTERGSINVGNTAATVFVLPQVQGHVAQAEHENLSTPLSAAVSTFIPPVTGPTVELLSTLSRAQLAGEFKAQPDVFTVAQTINTFLPPQGVLANDSDTILSGQFLQVLSINGVRVPANGSVSVTLPDGAIVIMSSDGSFTFDPTNIFIPLFQTHIEPVQFTYVATNGLVTSSAVVTLDVLGINDTPVINDNQVFSVPQYSALNAVVVAGTLIASDPDLGDILTYSIVGGTGASVFNIDPATGVITVNNLNVAALTIVPPIYTLTVQVVDSHPGVIGFLPFTVTNTVTINITHVTPQITNSPLSFHINEHSVAGNAVGHVAATNYIVNNVVINPDVGLFTYALSGTNVGQFSIDTHGNITVATGAVPFNFQQTPTMSISATVTDSYYNGVTANPNLTTTQPFTIFIDGIAITNNPLSFNVNVDSIPSTVVGTVTTVTTDPNPVPMFSITGGTGSTLFTINPLTGVISVASGATFDFQTTPSYTLTVGVQDNYAAVTTPLTDSATFTINIVGVAITNNPAVFSVLDHSHANSSIGQVTIASNPSSATGISYSITSGNSSGDLQINSNTGAISVAPGHTIDYATHPSYSITVSVADANPALPTTMITSQNFVINVQGIAITNNPSTFSIPDLSPGGTTVGQVTISSSDPNSATDTTYSITGGTGSTVFDINPTTGLITVDANATIDHSVHASYTLTVKVVDTYNAITVSDTNTFTININPPVNHLMALNGENTVNPSTMVLSASTLSLMAAVATQYWTVANITPAQSATLSHLVFTVGDLPNGMLGEQIGNHIIIDANAAGYGWYIDGHPMDPSAFAINLVDGNAWQATTTSGAYGHMDLLTVIMHEIGHAIGEPGLPYDANHPQVMAEQLATGTRILPPGVLVSDNGIHGPHGNEVLNFDNLQHPHQNGVVDDHGLANVKGSEIFSDVNALNLKAISSVFGQSTDPAVRPVNHVVDHDINPFHLGFHDSVQGANADIWYSSVDGSHNHYASASGSIVGMENHVPVLF